MTQRNETQPKEPPTVLPPTSTVPIDRLKSALTVSHSAETWIDRVLGGDSYGAPRVFDLFTLMAITLAFALMFAMLRLVEPVLMTDISGVAICLGTLVTGVAIFQLALWGGKRPRLASLIGGPFLVLGITLAVRLWQPSNPLPELTLTAAIGLSQFSLIVGLPTGYLSGAMVAGVFLIADLLRTSFLTRPGPPKTENDDEIFAD